MDAFMSAPVGGGDESAPPSDDAKASPTKIIVAKTVDAALEQAAEQRIASQQNDGEEEDGDDMDAFMSAAPPSGGGDESAPLVEDEEETSNLTIDSDPLDSSEELKQQLSDIQDLVGREGSIDVKDMTKTEAEGQATDMLSKMADDFIMSDDFELDPALHGSDEGAYDVLKEELAKLEKDLRS
jgi:hypothetical protein